MMKNKKLFIFTIQFFLFISVLSGKTETNWTIATTRFTFTRKQTDSLSKATAEMIPARILENISSNIYRNVEYDEKYTREIFELKKNRTSLILQLSSEFKKRDALFLQNYSQKELKQKIEDEEKKIQEIKAQIDENLVAQKEKEENIEKYLEQKEIALNQNAEKKKENSYSIFFKKLFSEDDTSLAPEKIGLYRDDIAYLYSPSEKSLEGGVASREFEKEMVNAKINSLITGEITSFDNYLLVEVEAFVFPGCKSIAVVTEVGTLEDADYICSNIARQLIPYLTNAMPIKLEFKLEPQNINAKLYIDDVLQQDIPEFLTIDSGIHYIQFVAEGYKTMGTNYNFDGNQNYIIEAVMEPFEIGSIKLSLLNDKFSGDFYADGMNVNPEEIKINGKAILGEFITEENKGAFFYVPQNLAVANNNLTLNLKDHNFDTNEYIELRRRRMYDSYSLLITSLIPLFVSQSFKDMYAGKKDEAAKKVSSGVYYGCMGVSIGSGVLFSYEIVRYLMAANKVLPQEAKKNKKTEQE